MKFDFAIGNPAYQVEAPGESTSDKPIYHEFMDAANEIADKVELITPARFLFNAGSTPKAWNKKMLNDPHFKILSFEQDSSKVFRETDIKGGVAISYRDRNANYGAIEVFTSFPELNSLMRKVSKNLWFESIQPLVVTRTAYRFTDKMHEEHPEAESMLSKGHAYDVSTNIFERLPHIFFNECPDDGKEYIRILGREDNKRTYKYVRRDYINNVSNLNKWKVILPKSNGSGALGEVLTTPLIGEPQTGNTESFISIGSLKSRAEAEALLKYVKSKFSRCMLGVLKITQDNPPDRWKYVPLQNFTSNSDINWNTSIKNIDRQLYKKYNLSDEEIEFVETHVKEMEE